MNLNRKVVGVPLWLLVIVTVACIATVGALVTYTLYYPQSATIEVKGQIKVYLNSELSQELTNTTTLDWGTLEVGLLGIFTKSLWIKNTGEVTVTVTFETMDLPLLWTETLTPIGLTIAPGEVKQAPLTLTVPLTVIAGTYTWHSWIVATEVM